MSLWSSDGDYARDCQWDLAELSHGSIVRVPRGTAYTPDESAIVRYCQDNADAIRQALEYLQNRRDVLIPDGRDRSWDAQRLEKLLEWASSADADCRRRIAGIRLTWGEPCPTKEAVAVLHRDTLVSFLRHCCLLGMP